MKKREVNGRIVQMLYRMTGQKYYLRDVDLVIDAFRYVIAEALRNDESIYINEFGKFIPKYIKERELFIYKLGEYRKIPAHKRVIFHPSPVFIQMIADGLARVDVQEDTNDEVDDA